MPGMPSVLQPLATNPQEFKTSRKLCLAYYVIYRHGSWAWKDKTAPVAGAGGAALIAWEPRG